MIPKIIHYCWFGDNHTQQQIDNLNKVVSHWKEKCPDYKIIEWNESNFDISKNRFASEAYLCRKWAFVADYARMKVLEEYGGIYLDTDVELLNNFDNFLDLPAFFGFESKWYICTAVIGAEKHNKLIKAWLSFYEKKSFILPIGALRFTPNVRILTRILKRTDCNFKGNNSYQVLNDCVIYPNDYFSPKNYHTKEIKLTDNTVSIHHFNGSWTNYYQIWSPKYISYKIKVRTYKEN